MQYYYSTNIKENRIKLPEEESRHCIKVLRNKQDDIIFVTDGKGNLYEGKIIEPSAKACEIEIISLKYGENNKSFKQHIAIAPTKNTDRFETFLEKATEIGIDEITPIVCENSERDKVNTDRLNKIIISAMKQSLKIWLPKLNEIIFFKGFVEKKINAQKLIAYCQTDEGQHLAGFCQKAKDVIILIGPEGDFSDDEINLAKQYAYYPVSLGKSRLRTETAGIVACSIINVINEI